MLCKVGHGCLHVVLCFGNTWGKGSRVCLMQRLAVVLQALTALLHWEGGTAFWWLSVVAQLPAAGSCLRSMCSAVTGAHACTSQAVCGWVTAASSCARCVALHGWQQLEWPCVWDSLEHRMAARVVQACSSRCHTYIHGASCLPSAVIWKRSCIQGML